MTIRMNIQHKTTTRKFPLNVLKSSHHLAVVVVVFVAVVCTVLVFLFTNVQLLCTERDAIYIYIFFFIHKSNRNGSIEPYQNSHHSSNSALFFSVARYCLANTFIAKWLFRFLFACKVVYDSFIHSLQNSTLTVTVEKWAMNARHLFECEFHWQSFFAWVCSLLFSQSTERMETMRGEKNDWKISFLMINISLTFTEHKKNPAAECIKHLWLSVLIFSPDSVFITSQRNLNQLVGVKWNGEREKSERA